jgi:hypothetical protein
MAYNLVTFHQGNPIVCPNFPKQLPSILQSLEAGENDA